MAVQMSTFISGRMDNVVFYKRSGNYFARSVPVKVAQSAATKIRSKNFGIAAGAGKVLRSMIGEVLPFPKDKGMQSRFSGAIAKWLGVSDAATLAPQSSLPHLQDFSFNNATSIKERWKLTLTVTAINDGSIDVMIPAFIPTEVLQAPAHTVSIEVSIVAASSDLQQGSPKGKASASILIPYHNTLIPAQTITLQLSIIAGCLIITTAAITYTLSNGKKDDRPAFLPCSIIDARYC